MHFGSTFALNHASSRNLIQMICQLLQSRFPSTPCSRSVTTETSADLMPFVTIGAHPYQMPILDDQPLYPAHRFQHLLNCNRTRMDRAIHGLLSRIAFPFFAHEGWPGVEIALNTYRRETPGSFCRIRQSRCDFFQGPFSHGACLRITDLQCGARTRVRRNPADRPLRL